MVEKMLTEVGLIDGPLVDGPLVKGEELGDLVVGFLLDEGFADCKL
jgi:hypothetical protein